MSEGSGTWCQSRELVLEVGWPCRVLQGVEGKLFHEGCALVLDLFVRRFGLLHGGDCRLKGGLGAAGCFLQHPFLQGGFEVQEVDLPWEVRARVPYLAVRD